MTTNPPTGIIDFFLHPPLGVCVLELMPNSPFAAGDYAFSRPRSGINLDAFGVLYSVVLAPLGMGQRPGLQTEFTQRVIELIVDHTLLDGTPVISDRFVSNLDSAFYLWPQALPTDVNVRIGPGFVCDIWWVLSL